MTLESDTVIINFTGLCKGEDLKATGVGEHRTMPLHELVQAAHVAHELIAGTQIEMIRVAQDERDIDILEMFRREGLDCRLRANRREYRCEQVAVWCGENPSAGAVVFGCDLKFEHRGDYNLAL